MKKSFFLAFALLLLVPFLNAQRPDGMPQGQGEKVGELKGVIIDKSTNSPMPFANVVLYKQRDSSMVDGVITNEKGAFTLSKLPYGRFYMMVQFVGYPPHRIDSIFIKPNAPSVNMGNISIQVKAVALNEVVIKGQKDALEFNLDRKVINIDQNIAAASSTAAEIMQTIPSVSVDIDGNVSLRGSSNVIILIDGRPSMLTSLDQLPANMVESVELITNPSAKYDPDGTSGMINIILKKKKEVGYNGMFTINVGTGSKLNSSLNVNFRKNKLNLFLDVNTRFDHMNGYSDLNRQTAFKDTILTLLQRQDFTMKSNFNNVRGGFDYFFNKKNTLSFSANYNMRNFNNEQDNSYKNYLDTSGVDNMNNYFTQISKNKNSGGGNELGLNYKKTFDKKIQELTVDLFYSNSNMDNKSDLTKNFFNTNMEPANINPFLQSISNNTNRKNFTAQLNYVHPVGNGGRIETGYKYSLNNSDMNYNMLQWDYPTNAWMNDTLASNEFIYKEQIHAGYFIYSNTIKEKFKYQAGLRAEQAFIDGNQVTMKEQYKRDTLNFFPSLHLKYDLSDMHSFSLSYSRRINRPGSRVMNPFINYSDPINLSKGNPYLNPEFINSYEVGYSLNYKKTNINTTVFYRNTDGIISRIMTIENNSFTSMTTYANINKEESYGVEFIVSQDLFKWWKLNANYSHYRTLLHGVGVNTQTNDDISWTFKLNSIMKFHKNLEIQATFNYDSPQIFTGGMSNYRMGSDAGGLGIQSANYFANLSVKKGILKDKGTVTLSLRDVLKSQKYDVVSYGDNFISHQLRRRDSRVLFVGFSYRINEYRKPKVKKNPDDMEEGD